jgi:hypothetical protein
MSWKGATDIDKKIQLIFYKERRHLDFDLTCCRQFYYPNGDLITNPVFLCHPHDSIKGVKSFSRFGKYAKRGIPIYLKNFVNSTEHIINSFGNFPKGLQFPKDFYFSGSILFNNIGEDQRRTLAKFLSPIEIANMKVQPTENLKYITRELILSDLFLRSNLDKL